LPTFLVIGAMKAGTTSLYHYLREHPQIYMPKIKEVDFFTDGRNWRRGLEWYTGQFAEAGAGAIATGEASTTYTKFPHYPGVAERIASCVPDARLVYVVRHPVDRIRSHYQHRVAVGAEHLPVHRAVLENPIYVDYSRYAMQVERYLDRFPLERVLIVTSEELRRNRGGTVQRVFDFLGVATDWVPSTLDREYYRTDERRVYPRAMWTVRRTVRRWFPASKRAKELVDSIGLRQASTRPREGGGSAPSEAETEIPSSVRAVLEGHLRADVSRLRAYLTLPFDGWGIG
jgi:hypothetical protein